MDKQSIKRLAAAVATVVVLSLIGFKVELQSQNYQAKKMYRSGPICPEPKCWAKWEKPQREDWRKSHERLKRRKADEVGQGCYR
jgi:hypothetical protein